MTPGNRHEYLTALGLVDWQLRDMSPVAPDTTAAAVAVRESEHAQSVESREMLTGSESVAAANSASPAPDSTDLSAMDWDELASWLQTQDHRGAQRAVFGTGAQDADVLIIGEAPGAREDEQGVPFVGPAGQLLDRMLAAIGRSRQRDVYITNICKFRPPGNRDPHADEVAADWPVLERQIELMAPKLVVAVGRVAAQTLLERTEPLGKLRGSVHDYPQRSLPVIVTYHPAYLLRSPEQKAKSWTDLRRIAALLDRVAA